MTVILGIDPGSRKTGFGVIRVERNQAQYVSSGTIRLPVKEALGARLRVLFESLSEIIDTYQPCLLYTSPSPRDRQKSRMPSSA